MIERCTDNSNIVIKRSIILYHAPTLYKHTISLVPLPFFSQPCHVVYTDYRPIPLQHYIFPAGGDGLHLVVDENVSVCFVCISWKKFSNVSYFF